MAELRARSYTGLSPGSAPFSRRGWAGACITVTSPPFRRLSSDRSSRYVQSVYTVTKPAQPSPSDSPPGSGESHFPAGEGERSFWPSWPVGCCCLLPRPRTRVRAHSRALSFWTRLSLQKAVWGAARRTSQAGSPSLPVSARTQRRAGATLVRLSVVDTSPLSPSSWVSRETPSRHSSLLRAGARSTLRHKVRLCHAFCAPSHLQACTRGHTTHQVSASCMRGSSPTPGPLSVRGNSTVRAPNAVGRAQNHSGP